VDDPRTGRNAPQAWPPAVMLNLTGLGLGYLHLRRWGFAAVHLALTAGLVGLAFATDAARAPWLWRILALLWVLGSAAVAAWLARRPAARRSAGVTGNVVPVVVAVVVLAAEVAGYAVYVAAADRTWDTATAALSRGDCGAAAPAFTQVGGVYQLTLSQHAGEAAESGRECSALVAADTARVEGRPADAVRAYRAFRADFPDSALRPTVDEELPRAVGEWAAALRKAGDPARAIGVYRDGLAEPQSDALRPELADTYLESATQLVADLPYGEGQLVAATGSVLDGLLIVRGEFADTPAAGRVGRVLTDLMTALGPRIAAMGPCPSMMALDTLARVRADRVPEIVDSVARQRATVLLACGLQRYRAGLLAPAVETLAVIEKSYPQSPELAQARSARIAADVALAVGRPAPAVPAPFAGDAVGPVPVTLYNVAPTPVQVLVGGSSMHQVELPACADCGADRQRACSTAAGRPQVVVRLAPGRFDVVIRAPGSPPRVGTITPAVDDEGVVRAVCYCVSTG